jgi:hypothetical protein
MFATILKCYFKFYKTFAIGLKLLGFKMQNLWKKKKTEIEKGSEQKKKERRGGHQPNWADPGPKPTEQQPS